MRATNKVINELQSKATAWMLCDLSKLLVRFSSSCSVVKIFSVLWNNDISFLTLAKSFSNMGHQIMGKRRAG